MTDKLNGIVNEGVNRKEFMELENKVEMLTISVDKLAKTTETFVSATQVQQEKLVEAVTHTVPEGHIPMSTHKLVVKGLVCAFSIVVTVAVGAVQFAPKLLHILGN